MIKCHENSDDLRGFSLIETLVLIVVVCLIGLGGWDVYQHRHKSATAAINSQTNTASSASAVSLKGVVLGLDTPVANESHAISEIGKTPALIDAFYQWQDTNNNYVAFPQSWVESVVQLSSTPMITWEPSAGGIGSSKTQASFNLAAIVGGKYDGYIKQWASAAKAENHTIYVRLMHEMNDSGYAWGAGVNGNTPSQYIAAYQHVVAIFQQQQANNVQFIWCIGANRLSPNPSVYYPGDKYVSWISIDGYNRNKPWTSFADIFSQPYKDITAISSRPVLIAETGSVEDPSNPQAKADWITAAFLQAIPNQFPRIKAVDYFDSSGNGYTYPIDSSSTTLTAIKQVYASTYYQATAPSSTVSF